MPKCKIEKNFESKTNVKSRKHEKSSLLARGRVLEWKPLRELNIGIIEFKLIGLLALNIRLSSPNPFFKKHAVKNMI